MNADGPAAPAAGERARYRYDAAGNLLEISSATPSVVSIVGFAPTTGGPGQLVTIFGSGFSPEPARNAVVLGGAPASVLGATASALVVAVPVGATTGPVAVSSGTTQATSAANFTVLTDVVVLDFDPRIGSAGTALSIAGFNFAPAPASNAVLVGDGSASVQSASLTWLGTEVGPGATPGKVRVTTTAGSGTSSADFYVLPRNLWAWDVGVTTRVSPGAPEGAVVQLDGQAALVLFDGLAGQHISLFVSQVTVGGSTRLTVYTPSGTALSANVVDQASEYKLTIPPLPIAGTYTIAIEPESGRAGALSVQVLPDALGSLWPGTAETTTLARGQDGRFTFEATAGAKLGLAVSALTVSPAGESSAVYVLRPDGSIHFGAFGVATPMSWQLPSLPLAGTYTVLIRPSGTAAASLTLLLSTAEILAVAVDGPSVPFENALPGRTTRHLFAGVAGDQVGLGIPSLAITPSGGALSLNLLGPTGAYLWNGAAPLPTSWQLPPLPMTGTYALDVTPPGVATALASLQLSRAIVGALATDGTISTFQSERVGQAGRYTFGAAQGQRFTLRVTAGANSGSFGLIVRPPISTALTSLSVAAGSDTKLDLGVLPDTGQYRLSLDPNGTATGQVTLQFIAGAGDEVLVDGAAKVIALEAAQNARYTLSGAAGDILGLGLQAITTTPAGSSISMQLFRPDGGSLWTSSASSPGSFQWPKLPVSGTYTLEIKPTGVSAAALTLLLSHPIPGTLASDGSPLVFSGSRVGQAGRFTFLGSAGQRFTLQATAGTYTGSIGVNVYQPNGAPLVWTSLLGGNDKKLDLAALPVDGTYQVTVEPVGVAVGQVTLRLVPVASEPLAIGEAPKTLVLGPAQDGRYPFPAIAGDLLGLGIQALTTVAPGGAVALGIFRPDGVSHWTSLASAPGGWQIPALPATGTYMLSVKPPAVAAATLTVALSRPDTGTLSAGGAPTTFPGNRTGQSGRYTFSGQAGERFTLQATAGSLTGTTMVTAYQPSGAALASVSLASGYDRKLDLGALPATGTCLVSVVPTAATQGPVTIRLVSGATGALVVGAAATTFSLGAAQHGRYSFSASSGALLKVDVSALTFTPAGGAMALYVYKPDGTTLWSASASAPATFQLPKLTLTGTYVLAIQPPGTAAAGFTVGLTGT